jgi:hypothetical protein
VPPVSEGGIGELDFGYQVTIDSFSGPMDLLLYLVRRAEVDITDIPIGHIADQFIDRHDHESQKGQVAGRNRVGPGEGVYEKFVDVSSRPLHLGALIHK